LLVETVGVYIYESSFYPSPLLFYTDSENLFLRYILGNSIPFGDTLEGN